MNGSIFLMSLSGIHWAGSKPLTPLTTRSHALAMSLPTGEMMPMPVTTTRRLLMLCSFVIPRSPTPADLRQCHPKDTLSGSVNDAPGAPYGIGRCEIQKRKLRRSGAAFDTGTCPHRPARGVPEGLAACHRNRSVLGVGLDVIDRLLHGGDLLRILVGNLGLELFFERHHQFHRVQRIRAQIIHERSVRRDFIFLHAQLLDDDFLDALFDGAHVAHTSQG